MYILEIITFLQQHIILSAIWVLLFIATLYTVINNWLFGHSEILRDKAIYLINRKNAMVIDIRSQDDYYAGHITNSINVSIEEIKSNNICKLKGLKQHPLIIVHDNNVLAHSIKQHLLHELKFKEIYVLHGGIVGWKADNFPLLSKK
ncbi:rhodanese-like domain-containing protein [Blochmannia endosymbiont of Camponotus sp. C-003]|uniref:rhodanese-like domain-containing protein n=1 Tax=unclassified Candidatus Blochmanniella TaxID=711328 RepID=UPI0020248825|nr:MULTISPECIES: rhodanese-like domain-containing protein [unclassified Candidatus Blochmannia]URJ23251.1 rhodanese-like domain-containing protein [Blochmannia endosymbiont of Camponotus sp. C-003]URJ28720.1 rhodanese-like domain-containing protein [Blochmannia endosymbiont of Camponotus sp. C-046]